MTRFTIKHHHTGEIITIDRTVTAVHPAWVHEQCGTADEEELQEMLDQYPANCERDNCGVEATTIE